MPFMSVVFINSRQGLFNFICAVTTQLHVKTDIVMYFWLKDSLFFLLK